MGEGVHAIDRATVPGIGGRGDLLRGAGDAADRRQHPDFIARADPAVGAAIALERGRPRLRQRLGRRRAPAIAFDSAEQRLEIVRMDMLARRNSPRGAADRPAELAHRLARRDRPQHDLVAVRHVLQRGHSGIDQFAASNRAQSHGDIVARVEAQDGAGFRRRIEELDAGHFSCEPVTGVI